MSNTPVLCLYLVLLGVCASVMSGPPVPVPSPMLSSGPSVPVLGTTPSSGNPTGPD